MGGLWKSENPHDVWIGFGNKVKHFWAVWFQIISEKILV